MITAEKRISRLAAAELLGISPRTLDRWCRRGIAGVKLRPAGVGARVFFTQEDLDRFQASVDRARKMQFQPIPTTRENRRKHEAARTRLEASGFAL